MQQRKNYIVGLKGIACVFVMIGHFFTVYTSSQYFPHSFPMLDVILDSHISFVFDAGFWLKLFFYISGYLVAQSDMRSLNDVVIKSVKRFFRLAIPILFSYSVIYLIHITIGFHNGNTTSLFQCAWFQKYYPEQYSLIHVLRGPVDVLLLGESFFNAPYWVLKEMFIASIVIYVLKYLRWVLSQKNETLSVLILMAVTFISIFSSAIVFDCLVGMLISIYDNDENVFKKPYCTVGVLVLTLLQHLTSGDAINIFFIMLIILVSRVRFIESFLSIKAFRFLGDISWGVYSFHWPLTCSLGALCVIILQPQCGLLRSYAISCMVVSLATVLISVLYKHTLEKLSLHVTSIIDMCIRKVSLIADKR